MRGVKKVLDHGLEKRPVFIVFLGLLLAQEAQILDRSLEPGIPNLCINFSGGDPPVTEGSLDQVKVVGFFIKPSSKRGSERVDGILLLDTCPFEPQAKPKLYLPGTDSNASPGKEQRFARFCRVALEIGFQKLFQGCAEEDDLFDPVFPINPKDPLAEINMFSVKSYQGPQSNACAQKNREHEVIPFGDGGPLGLESFNQGFDLQVGHGLGYSSRVTGHSDQAGRIDLKVTTLRQKPEKRSYDGLCPVLRNDSLRSAVLCHGKSCRG